MRTALVLCTAIAVASGCVPVQQQDSRPDRMTFVEDGYHIRVFHDGSASVALGPDVMDFRWSIDCTVDAMTDRRDCNMHSGTGGVFVYYGASPNPREVCVFGHDFPNRRGMIRVDKNAARTTDVEGCLSASSIWAQLLNGQSVTTRRYEWPRDYGKDKASTLDGLAKAHEIVGRIRSGSFAM